MSIITPLPLHEKQLTGLTLNINYLRIFYMSRVTALTTPRSAPVIYDLFTIRESFSRTVRFVRSVKPLFSQDGPYDPYGSTNFSKLLLVTMHETILIVIVVINIYNLRKVTLVLTKCLLTAESSCQRFRTDQNNNQSK